MRIALMPSAYAPAVGGVEVLTARLARQLVLQGHLVEIWAPRSTDDDLPAREVIDGLTVRRFVFAMPRADLRTIVGLPKLASQTVQALKAAAREFRPTHLHVQCFSGNGAYATALSKLTGIPLIVTLQGETLMDDRDIYEHSTTLRTALRLGLRHATAVTGCSDFTLRDARRRFGLRSPKGEVIFNGVDSTEIDPAMVSQPFERYIVALGRVVRKKGFDLLIDAFAQIAGDHPDLGLVIGGDGLDAGALRLQTDRLGLSSRIHFTGKLNRAQVAGLLSGAEMLVMPSRLEPFGIVALEGWRAGIPIIVTSQGGAGEFVEHEVSGMIVDPENTAELADALTRLAASPSLRKSLSSAGSTSLPDFQWSKITDRYTRVYRQAMASPLNA